MNQTIAASLEASSSPDSTENYADEGPSIPQPDQDLTSVAQAVPIQLRLQIGQLSLPFSELASLAPGHAFSLNKPLDQELITVYANDTAIAVGELVCIDSMVGVQIQRMLISNGSYPVPHACAESNGTW